MTRLHGEMPTPKDDMTDSEYEDYWHVVDDELATRSWQPPMSLHHIRMLDSTEEQISYGNSYIRALQLCVAGLTKDFAELVAIDEDPQA